MMIARTSGEDGREFLLLGLSSENLRRLQLGQAISLSRESHGDGIPKGWTIALIHGETEMAMKRQLERAGLVGPQTKMTVDPRLEG